MRTTLALALVGLCLVSCGCGPITLGARTVVIEPIHDWAVADNLLERQRDYRLAEETWNAIAQADSGHTYSPDFVHGFKDGFADYVYAGGTGEPPPLPPRYYWKTRYETPQGHQAVADWFAGFRMGAELARESGYREWVLIPSSLLRAEAADLPLFSSVPASTPPPPSEPLLPPPRKLGLAQDPELHSPDGGRPAAAAPPATVGKAAAQPALPPQ
jgi:hypothetical protein